MNIRTRRKIFYTLVALFIIIGGGVVFYAQGWRLDFADWHFTKVGGIYVRAYPEYASISLNGLPVQNQTGFLTPGTLISNLLPRTYSVELKATDYDDWQENATVEPSLVVQFKYAVLIPATGAPAPSGTAAEAVFANASRQATANTSTDPYDPNQKVIFGKNKILIFDVDAATTTQSAAISGKNVAVQWISGNVVGVLQSDGECYLYDTNAQTLTKLADDVKSFTATDDGSMVATLESQSLEIFSLTDPSIYYRFNLPDIADAQQAIWYRDKAHLFIVYPDHVSFLDLADPELMNFTKIADGTSPIYDENNNAFYIKNPLNQYLLYTFPL